MARAAGRPRLVRVSGTAAGTGDSGTPSATEPDPARSGPPGRSDPGAAAPDDAAQAAERVYQNVGRIIAAAEQYGKAPHVVARRMAERRIDLIGSLGHV